MAADGDIGFGGSFADDAGFVDAVGQGFFAVDVFAELQCGQSGKGVGMFAGTDDNGIKF